MAVEIDGPEIVCAHIEFHTLAIPLPCRVFDEAEQLLSNALSLIRGVNREVTEIIPSGVERSGCCAEVLPESKVMQEVKP